LRRRLLIASAIIALSLPAVPALAEDNPDDSPSFMLQYFDGTDEKKPNTLQLEQSIGDMKVGASASFQKPNSRNVAAGEDAEKLGVGVRLGFGGFTVEGAYEGAEGENTGPKNSYGASVGYSGGPFSATIGYVYDEDIAAGNKKGALELGATYRLSPGIAARGSLQYSEQGSASEKTDGVAVTGGIALSF
jgi:predicted porin